MTLRTSHKRGFVLENILKFPLPSFYAQLAAQHTVQIFFLITTKILFIGFFCHQGELLDVKDYYCPWCKANFLDSAHLALNLSQCTYSAGWYTYYRRIYDSLVRRFLCQTFGFSMENDFYHISFQHCYSFLLFPFFFNAFYSLFKKSKWLWIHGPKNDSLF